MGLPTENSVKMVRVGDLLTRESVANAGGQ